MQSKVNHGGDNDFSSFLSWTMQITWPPVCCAAETKASKLGVTIFCALAVTIICALFPAASADMNSAAFGSFSFLSCYNKNHLH